jgi:hypothetical protein
VIALAFSEAFALLLGYTLGAFAKEVKFESSWYRHASSLLG